MKLTVAVVALNAADDLPVTLESVIQQDGVDVELLVVDGASWDETPAVLALYQDDITRMEVMEDGGIYDAMNRTADLASGDMILFINAGDRLNTKDSLARLLERKRPTTDILYGNHIYRQGGCEFFRQSFDVREMMSRLRDGALSREWIERFPAHQSTLVRTSLLRDLRYDTAFRVCADHDFFLRAITRGAEAQFVDEVVSLYHAGGFSERRHELLKLEWNALHRHYAADPALVDDWYFGGASPFRGTRSASSGEAIAGLQPEQPARPGLGIHHAFRWLSGDGARLASPALAASTALVVSGTNLFAGQSVTVMAGEDVIAEAVVPKGKFSVDITFDRAMVPGAVIDVIAEASGYPDTADNLVSLAVGTYFFRAGVETAPRKVGSVLRFNRAGSVENAELLGVGWHQFEPDFIWSRGDYCELHLSSLQKVETLTFQMRPNPTVPTQKVVVTINGEPVADIEVESDEPVSVGAYWRGRGQGNIIALRPSGSGTVGSDPRDLGIALFSLAVG